jgi:hypothetical protein
MNYRLFTTIIISLLTTIIISGQSFSEKRVFQKSSPVNREVTLEINNKYGTIHITPWDKDSVSVKAEIEATASKLDRLQKIMEGVRIDFLDTRFLVRAVTEFQQNFNMLVESFKGMTDKLIPYDSRIQINYFISVPEYLNIRITNRYGNVYMENTTGKFSLNLSNGSFKANSLDLTDNLELAFCDATINRINKAHIDASFSEVTIGESKDLSINSISSRFDLEKAENINIDSRRDKFFIGKVKALKGTSYFTDFRISEMEKEINLVAKYGSVRANLLNKSTEIVTIYSGYTDIDLSFDPALSYTLDIKHTNTFLVLPEGNSKFEKKTIDDEKKEYMTYGTVGKNPGIVKVSIDATRGNIYLK